MMPATTNPNADKLSEIKSVLRSLLISTGSSDITVRKLNGMYREMEDQNIPFGEFNYRNLNEFLSSIPDTLQLRYNKGGELCAYHVDTEKTIHVSSLIARQRKPQKRSRSTCTYRPRSSFQHYQQYATRPSPMPSYSQVSTDIVSAIIDKVRHSSYRKQGQGIRKADLLIKIRERIGRNTSYTIQHLNKNLSDLSYMLTIHGDYVYLKDELINAQNSQRTNYTDIQQSTSQTNYVSKPIQFNNTHQQPVSSDNSFKKPVYTNNTAQESINENKPVQQPVYTNNTVQRSINENKPVQQPVYTNNTVQRSINENKPVQQPVYSSNTDQQSNHKYKQAEPSVCNDFNCNEVNIQQNPPQNCNEKLSNAQQLEKQPSVKTNSVNDDGVIKDRTKIRLEKLIEKHPEGIWCSELPSVYKREYNIELEYNELGFNSITEFVAALPDIFLVVEPPNTNRQMVVNAKKINELSETNHRKKTLASLYNFDDYIAGDPEPIPIKLSSEVTRTLIPEGVMSLNETVDQITVSSLIIEDYVEVNISEIFTPSFFWITLRKNKKKIKTLMTELGAFYSNTRDLDAYKIPQVVLQSGLNVACVYADQWHRGIIYKIKPDGFVVIAFYDYGTVKTYNPNELYFLNKKFSSLPAQAIACGLYNTKPKGSSEWSNEAYDQFVARVWNLPLIAFINSVNEDNNTMMITLTDTSDDLLDVHINDWMVENNLAEFGKMIDSVPIHRLSMYDEIELMKVKEKHKKSKTNHKSKNTEDIEHDYLEDNNRESSVISPNPSSYYIGSSCETFNVATLVKENMDLMKQTNTIAQAILLNMPLNRLDTTTNNNNLDSKITATNSQGLDNHYNTKLTNPESITKFTAELNKNLRTVKVNISEMNNNYFGSEVFKNESTNQNKDLKDKLNYRGSVQSLNSHPLNFQNNSNHQNGPLQSGPHSNEYIERRSSVHSTYSSNYDFQPIEEECNDSGTDCDTVSFNNGTLEIKLHTNLPKSKKINIKYPSKFANLCNNKSEIHSKPVEINSNKICNGNSNLQEETDEGYTTRPSTSQTHSNLSSSMSNTSPLTNSVFTVIYLSDRCEGKQIHIFHLDNEGWLCTSEFVDAFTNLKDQRVMLKLLQILEYEVNFKELTREGEPQLFSQLDKSKLKVPREDNKIVSNFILILLPLKSMLQVLVKLDFLNSKVVKEALPLMKQCKEDVENILFEQYNNKILYDVLNLLVQYKQFKCLLKSTSQ